MKNNKGFAITSIIYAMLILFLGLILLILGNLASRKAMFDKEKNEILSRFNGDEAGLRKYKNGEVVYIDVDNGTECSNYTETQSNTGVKSGCMKFYAFNDDGGNNLNLLLDHNTTATVAWNSTSGSNTSGPKEVLEQLKKDTLYWVGTITPENYSIDQSDQTSKAKYTVDYSSYKARLITANEVAQITGNKTWSEKTSDSAFYFDTNTSTAGATCKSGDTSGCNYGWLYDRTHKSCTNYGCLNNTDLTTYGYWTISSSASYSDLAWYVNSGGRLEYYDVALGSGYGVRPVITISKSKLKNSSSVLCTAKTTATTGNVPSGNYAYGDEYTCELGDNDAKTFFVLETNGDNVSLIMDRNVDSTGKGTTSGNTVAWCKSGSNNSCAADGALEYLKNSTTGWTKLTESQISLPTGQQIATAGGDSAWTNSKSTGTTLSTWLYGNLNSSSAPYGYWTSTPRASYSDSAWRVGYGGRLGSLGVGYDYVDGVRPVITVSKSNLS